MKHSAKAPLYVLALILLLAMLPVTALAEAHTHNYIVITTYEGYRYYSNTQHVYVEEHKHQCSCGDVYYETHNTYGAHVALAGSGKNLGTTIDDNGQTVTTYQYTCRICGFTYRRSIYS